MDFNFMITIAGSVIGILIIAFIVFYGRDEQAKEEKEKADKLNHNSH